MNWIHVVSADGRYVAFPFDSSFKYWNEAGIIHWTGDKYVSYSDAWKLLGMAQSFIVK